MVDKVELEAEVRDLHRFFMPPEPAPALHQGMSGQSCANLRHALSMLGYDVEFGNDYDDALADAVRQFQKDCLHRHVDGHCGAGTRELLIRRLLTSKKGGFFKRAADPENRALGHVFLSYSRRDAQIVKKHEALLSGWGFTPWRDESSIPGGAEWEREIQQRIAGAYLVVAFATRAFAESEMCRLEIASSMDAAKPVLVLRFAETPADHWLAPVTRTRQWIHTPPKDPFSPRATEFREAFRKAVRAAHRSAHGA